MIDNDLIKKIEKAFGFELYEWQKDYLLDNGRMIRGGRCNGKTFAYCLKMLLSDGDKIRERELEELADEYHGNHYKIWFVKFIKDINRTLVENGIETRLIK